MPPVSWARRYPNRLALLLAALLASGCSVPNLDLDAKTCPCAAGWACDTRSNLCVKAGPERDTSDATAGDGGPGSDADGVVEPGKREADAGMRDAAAPDLSKLTDSDGDGVADGEDDCPNDPDKASLGECGCGLPETDRDADGTLDCSDGCPDNPLKPAAGLCGCGLTDEDADADGMPDCDDACPDDPLKRSPGFCGCGQSDQDADRDTTPDCFDDCAADPKKTSPGVCGCGTADSNRDGDRALDCLDDCPLDPGKTEAGICGCGVSDTDGDRDGTPDCNDRCPGDPGKVSAGLCGCGRSDADADGDGTPDCLDECPAHVGKTSPGACGCGVADVDGDGDGAPDCKDGCPTDRDKTQPGVCGCGSPDADGDSDGVLDCEDGCPSDGTKSAAGVCGCGVAEGSCPIYSASRQAPQKNEGAAQAFDGRSDTKWLGDGDANWIQVQLPGEGEAYDHYSITSANDRSERDPRDFRLLGSQDGASWQVLDTRTGEQFTSRFLTREFPFPNQTTYRYYRLDISSTLDPPSSAHVQLAELSFRFTGQADECPADAYKVVPGVCGCGTPDLDSDGDGTLDCLDECPDNDQLSDKGPCGCGNQTPDGSCEQTTRLVVEDAVIAPGNAETNFGAEHLLQVDAGPTRYESLIKPTDLGDIPAGATVLQAYLVVNLFDPGNDIAVHALASPWDESSVTYSTAPNVGPLLATLPGARAIAVSVAVTEAVQAWVNGAPAVGFGLYPTGDNGLDIRSSEYISQTERPYIEVLWSAPSAGP